MQTRLIYITTANMKEAREIGRLLLEKRLVACINIINAMQSMYWWEGTIQESREAVLIAKTTLQRVPALIASVKENHSYECPCIVALPIETGNPDFLKWISAETGNSRAPEKSSPGP